MKNITQKKKKSDTGSSLDLDTSSVDRHKDNVDVGPAIRHRVKKKWLIRLLILAILSIFLAAIGSTYYLRQEAAKKEKQEQAAKIEKIKKIAFAKANRKVNENFVLDDGRNIKVSFVFIIDVKNTYITQRKVHVTILGPNKEDHFKGLKLVDVNGVMVSDQYDPDISIDSYIFDVVDEESKDYKLVFSDGNTVNLQPYKYYATDRVSPSPTPAPTPTYTQPSGTRCNSYTLGDSVITNCYNY